MHSINLSSLINSQYGKDYLLNVLPSRFLGLAAAWEDIFEKINCLLEFAEDTISSNDSSKLEEDLTNNLIIADTLKEVCLQNGLPIFVEPLERIIDSLIALLEENQTEKIKYIAEDLDVKINTLLQIVDKQKKQEENNAVLVDNHDIIKDLFLISADQQFVEECTTDLSPYGYNLYVFNSYLEYKNLKQFNDPIAIIVDYDCLDSEQREDLTKEMNDIRIDTYNHNVDLREDVLVISSQVDFYTRLQAVRTGSAAFFKKPTTTTKIMDKLDQIIEKKLVLDHYRILIVDDSQTMLKFLTKTLEQANMLVKVETNPELLFSHINEFQPDLILLDMYMPLCDGYELSKIIRQNDNYSSIPIVFLSSETDLKKQMLAMHMGADDFLTKPIDPDYLVKSVKNRVQRHRILSTYIIQDSLTGLLNHTRLKIRLDQTIEKADRANIPVAFAMVDIDNFKKVNDTHGHPVGDKVIKSLSKLLQKRLRKTDSIGRYGGEEFGIILWNTDKDNAQKILNQIREDFKKIVHEGKNGEHFYCTFSAGFAMLEDFKTTSLLNNEADKALYEAKKLGRNMVCVSQSVKKVKK